MQRIWRARGNAKWFHLTTSATLFLHHPCPSHQANALLRVHIYNMYSRQCVISMISSNRGPHGAAPGNLFVRAWAERTWNSIYAAVTKVAAAGFLLKKAPLKADASERPNLCARNSGGGVVLFVCANLISTLFELFFLFLLSNARPHSFLCLCRRRLLPAR